MMKLVLGLLIAAAILLGSLLALRRNRNKDLPSAEVVDRVKQREQQIEARERAEQDD